MLKKILFTTTILLSAFSITTFAGSENCMSRDVHCSYFVGSTGKYVKAHLIVNYRDRATFWICAGDRSTLTIDPEDIGLRYQVGDIVNVKYTQCEDVNCKRGIDIGYETFTIKKTWDDDYYSAPLTYAVHMKNGYGKACTNSSGRKIQ